MAQPTTFRRALALVIWVVVPILVIFAALAVAGELRVVIAAICAVVAIVLAMIPARRLVRDFDDATDYANRLADGAQVAPPDVGTETAAAMVSALERLRRGVKTRD